MDSPESCRVAVRDTEASYEARREILPGWLFEFVQMKPEVAVGVVDCRFGGDGLQVRFRANASSCRRVAMTCARPCAPHPSE